jgi:anti-anti-sigma factor
VSTNAQTLTLRSDLAELSRVKALVDEVCDQSHASAADASALHLAVEEIVTNVITYGYPDGPHHTFTVSLEAVASDRVRAIVTDDAPAFNPLAQPDVNTTLPLAERPVGGLGIHLVRQLMNVCLYEHRDGFNVFTMERQLNRGSDSTARIAATKLESAVTLALSGRLDGLSSPELEQQVAALLAFGIRTLVFDLSALEYVSSAGLRVFIIAAKKLKASGGVAQFTSLTPAVHDVFHISGLLTAFGVAPPA